MSTFDEVCLPRTNHIRLKRLWAQEDVSKSMVPTIFGYRFSKAFPHDTVTALVMIAPRLLAAKRYFCTMESRSPSRSGRPVLYRYLDRDVFDAMLLFLAFFKFLFHSVAKPSNGTFIQIWKLSFDLSYRGCCPIFRSILSDGITILFLPF